MKTIILAGFFFLVVIQPCTPYPLASSGGTDVTEDLCGDCHTVIGLVEQKFQGADRDEVLQNFLQACSGMEKLSEVCSNINSTFFNEIYKYLKRTFHPNGFCFLNGECSTDASIVPAIQVIQSLPIGEHDSPECELCKELVKHLVTNLTEDNFHELLLDVCKQMESFQPDCTRIANEYYPLLHDFLLDKLNLKAVCSFIGICPGPGLFSAPVPVASVKAIPKPVPSPATVPVVNVNKAEPSVQPATSPAPRTSTVKTSPSDFHGAGTSLSNTHSGGYDPFSIFFPKYESTQTHSLLSFNTAPAYSFTSLALPAISALPAFAVLG